MAHLISPGFEPANQTLISTLPELVVNHTLNCCFAVVFGFFNVPLLATLLSSRTFRSRYLVLIFLCLADSSNCLAIFLMGLNRVIMYSDVIISQMTPIRHPWECATEPWIWFRGIGDLWPPMVQVLIGIERATAVFFPWFYNRIEGNLSRVTLMFFSMIYVGIVIAIGFYQAWERQDVKAPYYCGRKAAFSDQYGRYIYLSNIVCYTFGCFVCFCAFLKCIRLKDVQTESMHRVRYTLVISTISTILVSLPNAISLLKAWIPIADVIAKPSVYASSVNSGLNFFVYFILNPEFRDRFLEICRIRGKSSSITIIEPMTHSHYTGASREIRSESSRH